MFNSQTAATRTAYFLREYERVMAEARALVMQRDESGRNLLISPFEMFPHGPTDVLALLWIKIGRAIGNERAGQWDLVDAEIQDVLNYAAFYAVMRADWEGQQGSTLILLPPDEPTGEVVAPAHEHDHDEEAPQPTWFRYVGEPTRRSNDRLWHLLVADDGDPLHGRCGYVPSFGQTEEINDLDPVIVEAARTGGLCEACLGIQA